MNDDMRAVNTTRYALLGHRIEEARTLRQRMKGLLGTRSLPKGGGLWITPCRAIHTIGMRYEIDVLFLDHRGKVVGLRRQFPRNRISTTYLRANGVLELPAGTIHRTGTLVGDRIEFQPDEEGE